MTRADDLASILADGKPGVPEVGFRQGTVVSFDLFTANSVVDVGGALLTDVPVSGMAGQVFFKPGDAVLMARYGASWVILGRFVTPGGIAAIGRYFELTGTYSGATASGYALTTSFVTQPTLAINVPTWAEIATVTASLHTQARNTSGAADLTQGRILYPDGNTTTGTGTSVPTGAAGAFSNFSSQTVVGHYQFEVTPGGVITLEGQVRTLVAGWGANAGNAAFVQATVAWNSNDGP